MIAKFFYPKAIKDIIAKLIENDELDRVVLRRLNMFIYKRLAMHGALAAIPVMVAQYDGAEWYLKVMLYLGAYLVMMSCFKGIYDMLSRYGVLYTAGMRVYGITTSEHAGKASAPWEVTYSFEVPDTIYDGTSGKVTGFIAPLTHRRGQDILICYHPDKPTMNVPLTASLKRIFHLKKDG